MPLVPFACAWTLGVLLAVFWPGAAPDQARVAAGAALGCVAALALGWRAPRARWIALALCGLWFGLARGLLTAPPPAPPAGSLRALNVPAVDACSAAAPRRQVRGRLLSDPTPAQSGRATQMRIAADAVFENGAWRPAQGALLAIGPLYPGVWQGDLVECAGVLQDPPDVPGFDYRAWLARHGIESYIGRATVRALDAAAAGPTTILARWRRDAGLRAATMLPEPEAGLLRALLLGQGWAVSPALRADFSLTGTSWLVVISGAHLAMLMLFVFQPLRRLLPPWPPVLLAAALTLGYAVFVGMGVPVARAALMGALYLLAQGLGRPVSKLNLLAVAALTLTAWDPQVVADAGFQLSFAAVVGILLFAPPLSARWRRVPLVGDACAVAVAVQIAISPLVALQFDQFQPAALPAGAVGGLLLAPAMALGSLQMLAAWAWAPLGQIIAWLCWPPLAAMALIVTLFAAAPLASIPVPDFGAAGLILWYGALAAGYVAVSPARRAAVRRLLRPA
jgi:competence protein ComEC